MKKLTQEKFAALIGLTKGRVSDYVSQGMPTSREGIDPVAARRWMRDNLDPAKRERAKSVSADQRPQTTADQRELKPAKSENAERRSQTRLGPIAKARAVKLGQESELLAIELKQAKGNAWDRKEVEAAAFGRARFERDAWHGWTARAAVALASDLAADPQATHAALDKLVRAHLAELAATPWEIGK